MDKRIGQREVSDTCWVSLSLLNQTFSNIAGARLRTGGIVFFTAEQKLLREQWIEGMLKGTTGSRTP